MEVSAGYKDNFLNTKTLVLIYATDTSQAHSAAVTKAVYGVAVDPHVENRVASFSEVFVMLHKLYLHL